MINNKIQRLLSQTSKGYSGERNCFGLLMFLKGLTKEETYVSPKEVNNFLDRLTKIEQLEADSIIIYYNKEHKEFWHGIYVLDTNEESIANVVHREFSTKHSLTETEMLALGLDYRVKLTTLLDPRIAKYHYNSEEYKTLFFR